MAHEKQYWKDTLQAAKSEGGGFDDSIDQRIEKKKARLMYTKRLLEKEIKKLLKNKIIKYGEIVRLHRKYGVQSTGTL
tara:strand:+ start:36 stop:269 length:234 start_codon:yes stop_codon:yes gene_type:complete